MRFGWALPNTRCLRLSVGGTVSEPYHSSYINYQRHQKVLTQPRRYYYISPSSERTLNSINSYYEKILATGEVKCIDEEIPFEIPQGWEWERIGNLFETTSGSTPLSRNPDYYQNSSINWVRTTDLNNGVLCTTEIQITEKACSDYNLTILPQNSVCIAMYGGAGTIGKHSILQFDTTINQSVCAIKPNGYCNMDYLHTFIEYQRPYWMDFAAGSRKDPNINQLIIKHCLLPIPPQKEQTRIVEKLSLLHPYITQYGECQIKLDYINKEILDKFKKSILQEAIQGKLVPQLTEEGTAQDLLEQIKIEKQNLVKGGKLKKSALATSVIFRGDDNKYYEQIGKKCLDITEQIPFDLPESWSWARGMSVFMPMESTKPSSDFVYIDVDAVNNRLNIIDNPKKVRFENAPSRATRKLHKNDLLFSMVRPYLKNIALVDDRYIDAIASTGFYVITPSLGYYPMFLFYLMLSNYVVDGLNAFMKGDNSPSINNCHIEDYLYPLPPIEEQKRIVNKIEQLFKQLR